MENTVCEAYLDINIAYSKDPFPFPLIDSLIDVTTCHELLTFMDASAGLQQIQIQLSDQDNFAFITPILIYSYIDMPFFHKNIAETYQRHVNRVFTYKLWDTKELYINNMVVKYKRVIDDLRDLGESFDILDEYNINLNTSKR